METEFEKIQRLEEILMRIESKINNVEEKISSIDARLKFVDTIYGTVGPQVIEPDNIVSDVSVLKDSIEVLKQMTGKNDVDIRILKRRIT